ncbi:putative glycerophosphoryl diester phosphodiesterase 2 [Dorcoceras hygrometricum]|uniref:Putative glycerophosphoryl diester phosphodiesterase 2 n=1 Tax=Dorcoceras hygrometricum TaxID=472368 RepID=A0A2Z7DGX5_9LAMI|nr:putative glycerophosphoryl diester phosphodiesterase 2 [Dorcoceras hygrometricum]
MASSLISNTNQVHFASVLAMDNAGIVAMFEALVASGLISFLGCMSDIFETALVGFYQNSSVRDGKVISTVQGKSVEISEEVFAGTFQLPAVVYHFTYMVMPGSRKARGYAVGRYISINDKISVEDVGDVSRVKKTPVKRAVSKKRPATAVAELVLRKKRTLKGKAAPSNENLELVLVAQEAVPLQVIKPITAAPPKPKRKATKRKLILPVGSADEIVEEETDVEKQREEPTADVVVNEPTVATFVEKEKETSGDDVDFIIQQILEDTAQLETDMGDTDETVVGGPTIQTSDDFISGDFQLVTSEADRMIGMENDPDEEKRTDDESMSLEEILSMIPPGSSLPSTTGEKLAALKLEEIYAKEELVLTWAETDSTKVALHRRTYILTKYRELLLRKFLETHNSNFVSGTPSSAIDLQVLDKLSDLHLFVLEELKAQTQEHGLRWEKTCCYKIFEGKSRDRGAVIAQSNTNTISSCWIRTMVRVNDSWVIEACADYWKPLPRKVVCNEVLPQVSYIDTLPTVSEFFKLLKKRWADVCLEAAEFFVSGTLLPMDIDQHPDSPPTSADSSLHFNANDIITEEDSANDQLISPSTATPTTTDIAASFAQLRVSIDQVQFEQIRRKDDMDELKDILLMHIRDLEKQFSDRFDQHDRAYMVLINSIRQEIHDQKTLLSLYFLTSQKRISTQVEAMATGLTDVQKDVQDTKYAFFHQLLDFHAQAQENYNNHTTQLGELVDYINRGGNDKKGEESSSSRPQPPPDDQNRPSGGSASRGGGSGGSSRREDRRGSSKRRSSSGGGGSGTGSEPYGPYKKNAEWWLYGKNQF